MKRFFVVRVAAPRATAPASRSAAQANGPSRTRGGWVCLAHKAISRLAGCVRFVLCDPAPLVGRIGVKLQSPVKVVSNLSLLLCACNGKGSHQTVRQRLENLGAC